MLIIINNIFEATDHSISYLLEIVSRLVFMRLTQFRTHELSNYITLSTACSLLTLSLFRSSLSLAYGWMNGCKCEWIQKWLHMIFNASHSRIVLFCLALTKCYVKLLKTSICTNLNFWNQSVIDINEICGHLIRAFKVTKR